MRILALAAVPACFGGGPAPTRPADATVVLALPPPPGQQGMQCTGQVPYLGSVAIGATTGYAVTLPYEGPGCQGSFMIPFTDVPVLAFAKDGSKPEGTVMAPTIGQSDAATRPRIAASGDTAFWAIGNGSTLALGGGTTASLASFASVDTAALVADDAAVYVGGWLTQNGQSDPNSPPFPNGESVPEFDLAPNLVGSPTYTLTRVARDTSTTSFGMPALFCEVMADCLVQNTASLFAMARGTGSHVAVISAIDKATGTSTDVDTIESDLAGNAGPVGLAADDTHVVWTAAVDPKLGTGCFVFAHALGGATTMLLSTTKFSCTDAALDGDAIYFAIVSIDETGALHGDGIGRVAIADGAFDSVALGIVGVASGPRRIYVDGGDLYVVDPLAIAKIPTAAITGQDF